MNKLLIGTSAGPGANVALIQEAGIGWVRQDFPFPFADRLGGKLTDGYRQAKETAKIWCEQGLMVMGVTPLIGIGGYQADVGGVMQFIWQDWLPAWMGSSGSEDYYRQYQELCVFLAQDLRGIVQMWQVTNEMDIPIFAGPLKPRQASELILRAARGLKETDSSLIVGTNTAGVDTPTICTAASMPTPRATWITAAWTVTTVHGPRGSRRLGPGALPSCTS